MSQEEFKSNGYVGGSYETKDGSSVRDAITYMIDYFVMDEAHKDLIDSLMANTTTVLASKLYAPDMIPPPFHASRTEGLGKLLLDMVEHFGRYKIKPNFHYYLTVHPQLTINKELVLRFQLLEVALDADVVSDKNMVTAYHMMFENVDDMVQTLFKRDYEAMLEHITKAEGKAKADMKRMLNSSDFKTSLGAVSTQQDLFYTFTFYARPNEQSNPSN